MLSLLWWMGRPQPTIKGGQHLFQSSRTDLVTENDLAALHHSSFCCRKLALAVRIPGSCFTQFFPLVSQVGTSPRTSSGSVVDFGVGRGQKYRLKGNISSIFQWQLPPPTNPEGGGCGPPPGGTDMRNKPERPLWNSFLVFEDSEGFCGKVSVFGLPKFRWVNRIELRG